MRLLQNASRVLATGLLFVGLSASLLAQSKEDDKQQADRQGSATMMTGCLTKDTTGGYTLADEKTGVKLTVTGPSDLEKHSANHKVTLTGTTKTDASGKSVFEVTRIQHIAPECKAPSQ